MKRVAVAEPASVEDLSSETEDTVPNTRRIACRPNIQHPAESPKRRRTMDHVGHSRTKSAVSAVVCRARDRVPMEEAVRMYDGASTMTMLSGATDRSVERNGVDGCRLRKFFYEDLPVNSETTTFIERDLFVSEIDAANRNSSIWIEQRTYDSGKEVIMARELFFHERLVNWKVFIFEECGDEILGFGKIPNLHVTARVLPAAEGLEYSKTAVYYGYDTQVEIRPSRRDLKDGKAFSCQFKRELDAFSCSGIKVSSRRLPGQSLLGQDLYVFTILLQGLGERSEDQVVRGDLNLKICID